MLRSVHASEGANGGGLLVFQSSRRAEVRAAPLYFASGFEVSLQFRVAVLGMITTQALDMLARLSLGLDIPSLMQANKVAMRETLSHTFKLELPASHSSSMSRFRAKMNSVEVRPTARGGSTKAVEEAESILDHLQLHYQRM